MCGNCSRLSIPCNYAAPGSQPEGADLMVRKRGRPRKNWTVISAGPSTTSSQDSNTASSSPSSLTHSTGSDWHVERPLHLPWDTQDMELFFHYLNHLCVGLGLGDMQLWKDRIPRLAFRCHTVLHLLLAASALHLARQDSERRHQLEERAEMHLTVGLRRTTEILPNLNADNCAELYIATILVCICTFAKRPGPRNLLLVAEGEEVAWWTLFKGVRIVVETYGIPTVFSGELGPLPSDVDAAQRDEHPTNSHDHVDLKVIEWEGAFGGLSTLVSSIPNEGVRETCQGALNILTFCFQETYGTPESPKPFVYAKFETIMMWFYCLTDEFIGYLREDQPVPLILLAHFTVLLQTLDDIWFMSGWAAHVLRGVWGILGPAWYEWLRWPMLHIEKPESVGSYWASNTLDTEPAFQLWSQHMGGFEET